MLDVLIAGSLLGGTLVAGAVWCWARLIAPLAQSQSVHQEMLEIERELIVPCQVVEQPWAEGLFHLAAATSSAAKKVSKREETKYEVSSKCDAPAPEHRR